VAISKETMYVVEENGESVVEVPIPESIIDRVPFDHYYLHRIIL